jgi:hypothetical protein
MLEGLVIIWQLGASSYSPGGSIKVFVDARGGLCDCVAVRCQLLYSLGGFVKVFADARGGLFVIVRQ